MTTRLHDHLKNAVAVLAAGLLAETGIAAAPPPAMSIPNPDPAPANSAGLEFHSPFITNRVALLAGVEFLSVPGAKDDKDLFDEANSFYQIYGTIPVTEDFEVGLSLHVESSFAISNATKQIKDAGKPSIDTFAKADALGLMASPTWKMCPISFIRADLGAETYFNKDDGFDDSFGTSASAVIGLQSVGRPASLRGEVGFGTFDRFDKDKERSVLRILTTINAPILGIPGGLSISGEILGVENDDTAEARVNIGYEVALDSLKGIIGGTK